MQLRNCPRCGKVFRYDGLHLYCRECLEADEAAFRRVRECLVNDPGLTLGRLAEKAGVEESLILRFVREGRILADHIEGVTLRCDSCGKPISEGRFCSTCAEQLAGGLRPERARPPLCRGEPGKDGAGRSGRSRFYTREQG